MRIDLYLKMQMMSSAEFAELVGVSTAAVSQWRTGRRVPLDKHKRAIHEATGGKVGPMDWLHIEEPAA